jgi:ATP-binding protein involved in chromosome partitioning
MADGQATEAAVRELLATFQDPETGRPVTAVDQIHTLCLDGSKLSVTLGLTTWAAPFWEVTRLELTELLRGRFPALDVTVTVAEHNRPAEKIGQIGLAAKSVIAVGSGKGGVGKSSISVALAHGLSREGCRVGLMDADVYGPSIPHLLGSDERPTMADEKICPVVVDGMKVMSMGFFIPADEAVIWRGPMLHGALTQFLRDTDWGELDYLIIDMPPGTGDIALSLSQLLPLTGAVVVCTPQDVALLDATKAIAMYRKVNIDVLGMVENMSFFVCPDCDNRHDIFGSGGAKRKAAKLEIPFLGEVPLNTRLRILADEGKLGDLFVEEGSRPYLEAICENLLRNLIAKNRSQPTMPSLPILGQ